MSQIARSIVAVVRAHGRAALGIVCLVLVVVALVGLLATRGGATPTPHPTGIGQADSGDASATNTSLPDTPTPTSTDTPTPTVAPTATPVPPTPTPTPIGFTVSVLYGKVVPGGAAPNCVFTTYFNIFTTLPHGFTTITTKWTHYEDGAVANLPASTFTPGPPEGPITLPSAKYDIENWTDQWTFPAGYPASSHTYTDKLTVTVVESVTLPTPAVGTVSFTPAAGC